MYYIKVYGVTISEIPSPARSEISNFHYCLGSACCGTVIRDFHNTGFSSVFWNTCLYVVLHSLCLLSFLCCDLVINYNFLNLKENTDWPGPVWLVALSDSGWRWPGPAAHKVKRAIDARPPAFVWHTHTHTQRIPRAYTYPIAGLWFLNVYNKLSRFHLHINKIKLRYTYCIL